MIDILKTFVQRKTEIDEVLAELMNLSSDHFGVTPDEIGPNDVDTVSSMLRGLKMVLNQATMDMGN